MTLSNPPISNMITQPTINHQIITFKLLRAIGESLEPEGVAYLAVEKVIDLTGWVSVAILSPNHEGHLFVLAAMGTLLTDIGMNGRAFRTGDTQLDNELIGESDEGPTYQKTYSALSVPITRGRRRLGVFNIENEEPFTQDDVFLAEAMAEVIGLAMDNAELYAKAQRRLVAQTAMQEAVSVISSTLELSDVLKRIAEQMGQAVQATSTYICSYDKETMASMVLAEYYSQEASEQESQSDLGVTYYLPEDFPEDVEFLEEGRLGIQYFDDYGLSDGTKTHYEKYGAKTVLTIPLQVGGNTIAFAELWDSHEKRTFTDEQITLCRGIAQHAAIAIENARLFQAIREDHGRFQALIDSDEDGIILVSLQGQILVLNSPAHAVLHLPDNSHDWIGKNIETIIDVLSEKVPAAGTAFQAESDRILNGDELTAEGELEIPPKIIHWRNLPVLADGLALGRLIVMRDITTERALQRMQEDLTDTMVHDLRGPLTAVSISLEVLEMMESSGVATPEKRQNAIGRAQASTKKLLSLVESILEISRLESGHLALNHEFVDFTKIVNDAMDELLPVAQEKHISLMCHMPQSLPEINVDRALISRVLQNLIDNAVKFTPEDGKVCLTVNQDKDAAITVSVQDNGSGIPLDVQENLFQKFSRGDQKKRGSGLGLYFCRMVMEAHDGRIWLDHSDENGTTIQLKLPLVAVSQPQ